MGFDKILDRLKERIDQVDLALPLHRRLRNAMENAISNNELTRGAVLPGERQISEALGLSRVTVRKTISTMVDDGLLRVRHGARTEVSSPVEKSLSNLTSFSEDMTSRGIMPGCIWLEKKISRPSPTEMMALGVPATTDVIRCKRIRTGDGAPIAVETACVPARFLPNPDLIENSLYEALERRNALPQRALQRMRSRPATAADAALLNCSAGTPLLIVDRRCFLADGQIVEFTETRYSGEAYDFVIELNR
ncbi:GntR family transcriptional regulator [Devosia rhodophyticola]|uniref:GntR family transcriptional regulator n=1 Tax=Devosia rhodophyticola TaxID=3026423 RepID=A0ABY7Z134_9HYPH|nr:GntR family transcriptional regulator [Devosia rhodophyticola]WDR07252.1 GntR family transcriptional regulator [Devosia rhodophyticola]